MAATVLIDSGAIVAALSRRDRYHSWACAHFEALTAPCLTCEAVVSESFFLLEQSPGGKEALCALLERGIIEVAFALPGHLAEILHLIRRYRDTPMSFADACLVRMSEAHRESTVFTTDSDFLAYRRHGRERIPLIAPW